jgi:hypothetical protein
MSRGLGDFMRVPPGVRRPGPPRPEGGADAGRGGAQRSRLDSILKGVAGQVGGLLWDDLESDPAAVDDEDGDDGTAGAAV